MSLKSHGGNFMRELKISIGKGFRQIYVRIFHLLFMEKIDKRLNCPKAVIIGSFFLHNLGVL